MNNNIYTAEIYIIYWGTRPSATIYTLHQAGERLGRPYKDAEGLTAPSIPGSGQVIRERE
jgi:hypothetical protein